MCTRACVCACGVVRSKGSKSKDGFGHATRRNAGHMTSTAKVTRRWSHAPKNKHRKHINQCVRGCTYTMLASPRPSFTHVDHASSFTPTQTHRQQAKPSQPKAPPPSLPFPSPDLACIKPKTAEDQVYYTTTILPPPPPSPPPSPLPPPPSRPPPFPSSPTTIWQPPPGPEPAPAASAAASAATPTPALATSWPPSSPPSLPSNGPLLAPLNLR